MELVGSIQYPVLSVLIFWPLLASFIIIFLKSERLIRQATLLASIIEIILAWPLINFKAVGSFQFVEHLEWVRSIGLSYALGIDGISIYMVVLSLLILPLCVLCSWKYINFRVKEFHICLLWMTTACVGVFSALDLVLFYIFWEALLIPMYLIIAVWGGDQRRYASIKFFIYTLAGSTLLLVAIVALKIASYTFSIPDIMNIVFPFEFQFWIFLAMAIAFAIKVPMFPFHTWLPAAHVQAPAAGSVILAAVLLKMGTYGFLRFCLPIAPQASLFFAPLMITLSIISILYGGFVALGQKDIKKLVAYSSVAHMGFVTLGIFLFLPYGLEGAIFQMLSHGIITGALFMLIGAIYERSHSRDVENNLGLGQYLPIFMFFWGLFSLASFAFPGTNGFIGEILVLIAAFESNLLVGFLVIPGAMLAAAYMLRVTIKLAWGAPSKAGNWQDLNTREILYLIIPACLVIILGLAPQLVLKYITPTVDKTLSDFSAKTTIEFNMPAASDFIEVEDILEEDINSAEDPNSFTDEGIEFWIHEESYPDDSHQHHHDHFEETEQAVE